MKREGIFMVGDHLVGERANSGESERSTASSLASISYRSPRPAAPPAKMPAFARLLGYIANMKPSMTTAMAAPIRIAMERRVSMKRTCASAYVFRSIQRKLTTVEVAKLAAKSKEKRRYGKRCGR